MPLPRKIVDSQRRENVLSRSRDETQLAQTIYHRSVPMVVVRCNYALARVPVSFIIFNSSSITYAEGENDDHGLM